MAVSYTIYDFLKFRNHVSFEYAILLWLLNLNRLLEDKLHVN